MKFQKLKGTARSAFLLICVLAVPGASYAANHYVRAGATGSGDGSDWTNAFQQLPATLVRGDTYYLGAGNYPPYSFNTPNSGTTLIAIKAATIADHGTNVGWQASFAGQALFAIQTDHILDITTDYLILDGQGRTTKTSGYGIKLNGSGCTLSFCVDLDLSGRTHITLRYVEIQGAGDAGADVHIDENIRIVGNGVSGSGGTNLTFQFLYIHDSSDDPILTSDLDTITLEHSLIARNRSTPVNHGEGWADDGSSNITIRYNEFQDIEGTPFIDVLNRGGPAQIADNWNIYGNVFMYHQGNPYNRTGVGTEASLASTCRSACRICESCQAGSRSITSLAAQSEGGRPLRPGIALTRAAVKKLGRGFSRI